MAPEGSITVGKLRIRLVRSAIGRSENQKRTVAALGLRRLNQEVIQPANLQTLGMVRKIAHLVHVEQVEDEPAEARN